MSRIHPADPLTDEDLEKLEQRLLDTFREKYYSALMSGAVEVASLEAHDHRVAKIAMVAAGESFGMRERKDRDMQQNLLKFI